MRVHVWAENHSQPKDAAAMRKTYPLGIEVDIAAYLQRNEDMIVLSNAIRWACQKHYPDCFPDSKCETNIPTVK